MTVAAHDDGHAARMPDATVDLGPVRRAATVGLGLGAVGFIAFGALNFGAYNADHQSEAVRDLLLAYLIGYVLWAGLPFGSLALSCLGFLTTASWGVVLRRVFQANMRTLPVVVLLGLPVFASAWLGAASPFWWADPAATAATADKLTKPGVKEQADKLEAAKWDRSLAEAAAAAGTRPEAIQENREKVHDYLNPRFFTARVAVYFGVLGLFMHFLGKWSRPLEDNNDATFLSRIRGLAGPGLLLWALLGTFMATDWVMSVEPTWASSMFPVVFGMDQFMLTMSSGALVFYTVTANRPELMAVVKDKFRIDMGSLMFGFTMLWAYASFSQYMLIWAGNLPEEVGYYRKRTDHGWEYLAYFLMLFHWLIPFVLFLIREMKTDPRRMRALCTLLIVVAAADAVWWIMPAVPHEHGLWHVPLAVSGVLLVGGAWGLAFVSELGKRPILPSNREGEFLAGWGHGH